MTDGNYNIDIRSMKMPEMMAILKRNYIPYTEKENKSWFC